MNKRARSFALKIVMIGNARGVRLPKALLEKYAVKDLIIAEEREEGLLLRSRSDKRLSWDDTFKEMAREREDWSGLDSPPRIGPDPKGQW